MVLHPSYSIILLFSLYFSNLATPHIFHIYIFSFHHQDCWVCFILWNSLGPQDSFSCFLILAQQKTSSPKITEGNLLFRCFACILFLEIIVRSKILPPHVPPSSSIEFLHLGWPSHFHAVTNISFWHLATIRPFFIPSNISDASEVYAQFHLFLFTCSVSAAAYVWIYFNWFACQFLNDFCLKMYLSSLWDHLENY